MLVAVDNGVMSLENFFFHNNNSSIYLPICGRYAKDKNKFAQKRCRAKAENRNQKECGICEFGLVEKRNLKLQNNRQCKYGS